MLTSLERRLYITSASAISGSKIMLIRRIVLLSDITIFIKSFLRQHRTKTKQ